MILNIIFPVPEWVPQGQDLGLEGVMFHPGPFWNESVSVQVTFYSLRASDAYMRQ